MVSPESLSPAWRPAKWPTNTIRYYEMIPAKWQWSLDDSIKRWHGTGAPVRFVKVNSPAKARLIIRYGDTGGADGIGTLGYNAYGKNILFISPRYKRVNHHDPAQRAWVSRLFAHELGHNLGYGHVSGTCDLMAPVFYFGECGPLAATPGYYLCGYIDKALLARHVRWYGGRRRPQPKKCLLAPLPRKISDLTASGGTEAENSAVTLRWRGQRPPATGRFAIYAWQAASCARVPRNVAPVVRLRTTKRMWKDTEPAEGPWCYAVQVVNRYDGARKPVIRAVQRTRARPAAPQLGEFRWNAGQGAWDFTAVLAANTTLAAFTNGTSTCTTDPDHEVWLSNDNGRYAHYTYSAQECLTFVAVDLGSGLRSAPVTRQLQVPAPQQAPVIGPVTVTEYGELTTTFTTTEAGTTLRAAVVEGACPTSYPAHGDFAWDWGPAYTWLSTRGTYCIVARSTGSLDLSGPIATRLFTW